MSSLLSIHTPRMRLVALTPELMKAEKTSSAQLSRLLNAEIPEGWPPASLIPLQPWFLKQIHLHPEKVGWYLWHGLFQRPYLDILVISCGFMEPPDAHGGVEIGYATLPQWQSHGFASEAVPALMNWAFSHPDVSHIRARTARGNLASAHILEKCGFEQTFSDPMKPAIDRYICYRHLPIRQA
nr:GNAT family N-acetyltransferase [Desulfobotulus pelophilus]